MTAHYSSDYHKLLIESNERLKELACINKTVSIVKENRPIAETLKRAVSFIPPAWQFPENTVARIVYDDIFFTSMGFIETKWTQKKSLKTLEGKIITVEVYYTLEFEEIFEGPFLKEERDLIDNITLILTNYINSYNSLELLKNNDSTQDILTDLSTQVFKPGNGKLIQRFINKHNYDRDVYHDLMPYKVKEILFVSNLYDAYSIEKEGRFTEHILGEYHQLNLASMPRITGVSYYDNVVELFQGRHFDLVIVMMGVDKKKPFEILKKIKEETVYTPVYLLLNSSYDIEYAEKQNVKEIFFDNVFVWNGDSKIFFAMIKLLEDKVNIDNDVHKALVPVIILVEDSPKYYSRVLPVLYNIILEQTRQQIEDVHADELYKVLKLRVRSKVLHAISLDQAKEYIDKYSNTLLCLITDVEYNSGGKADKEAGFKLIDYVRKFKVNVPILIQSGDPENHAKAYDIKTQFVNKHSETYLQDIRSFISFHIGLGNFIFRNTSGRQIAEAKSLKDFQAIIKTVPNETIEYHQNRNQFSLWLMTKGEIQVAKIISNLHVTEEIKGEEIRKAIIQAIGQYRVEKDKGRIVNFEETILDDETNIVSLSSGALGGKGRGLAFVNTLIYNFSLSNHIPGIKIRTPKTSIIGTDEFDFFIERNKLHELIHHETDYSVLRERFVEGELSFNLVKRLKLFLKHIKKPLAIRSSSLFEDSLSQPFSGVFETYLLPNNHL
ncbi:MAG: hypothetical protein CVU05_13015, partial [Bacteroidetes bacterium HGW-Bacteroidetes-21]